jgi:hypothetical protein
VSSFIGCDISFLDKMCRTYSQSDDLFVVIQSKFTNAFGSSRLLGSLALSPPGIRRPVSLESSKNSLAKEREVGFD